MYDETKSWELLKQVFAAFGVEYKENVPDNQVGIYDVKNGVEKRIDTDFLKEML